MKGMWFIPKGLWGDQIVTKYVSLVLKMLNPEGMALHLKR
jgi:hypothetical protein